MAATGTAALIAYIASATAAAAGTGVAIHNSQEAERHQKDAGRDQENAMLAQKGAADTANNQASAEKEQVMARSRQQALAGISKGSTYGGTLKTSPLGLPSTPQTSNKTLLGV